MSAPAIALIERVCSTAGGIVRVMATPSSNVVLPDYVYHPNTVLVDVLLNNSSLLSTIEFARGTARYSWRDVTDSPQGAFREHQLTMLLPRQRNIVDRYTALQRNKLIAFFITDVNGEQRMLPLMRATPAFDSGGAFNDKNAYTLSYTGRSYGAAIRYTGSVGSIGPWIDENGQPWIDENNQQWQLPIS